ncbi:hypothetical protein BH23CHL2_BH23CHL2_24900 [soil metagenome]
MAPERNKALVERYYGELNRGNLSIIDELIDKEFVAHDPNLPDDLREGIDGLKQTIERSRAAIRDQRIDLDDVIAEQDLVAFRIKVFGYLDRDWDSDYAGGQEIAFTGMGMVRIADGQIVEGWYNFDHYGLLQQLGALPASNRDPDDA